MTEDRRSISASRFKGAEDAVGKLTGDVRVEARGTALVGSRTVADTGRRYAHRTGSGHLS